jgi:hypothetical protein
MPYPKPTTDEAESLPPFDLDAIETAAKACTPLDFDTATAGKSEGGWVECPCCGGEGDVEREADYCNFDGKALGVQFYGIGHAHGAAEHFLRTASPKVVLDLVSTIRALQAIASLKAPAADGCVLVPLEPTEAMWDAGRDPVMYRDLNHYRLPDMPVPAWQIGPTGKVETDTSKGTTAVHVWRAMIAARPIPKEQT